MSREFAVEYESSKPVVERPTDRRDIVIAILCGLVVVIAVFATWPFAESPYNDDWSYSFTVKRLLETGRLTYNGWASASLIAQAYWGLLWVKIFGFSYTILRLSTIPLSSAAISICYLLARRASLRRGLAVFAALIAGLSPIYLPVAGTFMTDAPGLFCILLSMYAMVRGIESGKAGASVGWLVLGMVVGFIGGTGRQVVWVVPGVFAPYAAWLRRDSLPVLVTSIFGFVFVLAGAMLTLRWFNHQPYSIPELSIRYDLHVALHEKAHFVISVLAIALTLLWVILPALWGLINGWTGPRAVVALALIFSVAITLSITRKQNYARAPWMGNSLSYSGVMDGAELAGERPVAMPLVIRITFGVVVIAVACVLTTDLLFRLMRPNRLYQMLVRFFLFPRPDDVALPAMLLFALAYCALLLPRCSTNMVYDRYMLPLMPCVLIWIFRQYQATENDAIPFGALALFGLYSLYAIAATQEVTSLARARTVAAKLLMDHGIPRTQIDAGFEFDCETQLETTGYMNDPRLKNPRGAFNPDLSATYVVRPKYRLEFAPVADTFETEWGPVEYFSLLYPFHRRVHVDEYADPWWLNPRKAATRPAKKTYFISAPGLGED
jgi:4-amino-4-deoxy-L-arabinose transferase-like glycosyltransferase